MNYYPKRSKPYEWQKYRNIRGVLLADEVGGGKTFESLALISKAFLKASRSKRYIFRVLVIAAPAISMKWEWCQGKGPHCSVFDCNDCPKPKEFDSSKFLDQLNISGNRKRLLDSFFQPNTPYEFEAKRIRGRKDWKEKCDNLPRQGIWISSINALPPWIKKEGEIRFRRTGYNFPGNAFDWIVADEAHIVRSGYKIDFDERSSSMSNNTVRKLYALLNENPRAKLLALTATPFQNNVRELIQMIKLLGPQDDPGNIIDIVAKGLKEAQKRITTFLEHPSDIDDKKIKELYEGLANNISQLLGSNSGNNLKRPSDLRRNKQKDGLDDYMRDLIIRNRKRRLKQNIVYAKLSETDKFQYLLLRDLVYEKESEGNFSDQNVLGSDLVTKKGMVSQKLGQLVSSPGAFCRRIKDKDISLKIKQTKYKLIEGMFGGNLLFKNKLETLINEIERRVKEDSEKKVVIIYCRFIPTIDRLRAELEKKFSKKQVFTLDGRDKRRERQEILTKVGEANDGRGSPIVFLVSQVGNEGLDFDKFSRSVIHFDGHYNPAVIDQRNGRVYRGRNSASNIRTCQIVLSDTYDQRIKFIEMAKRKLKDFYLGDSTLHDIFEKILRENHFIKKKYLDKLLNFKIDLEPRRELLLKQVRKEI